MSAAPPRVAIRGSNGVHHALRDFQGQRPASVRVLRVLAGQGVQVDTTTAAGRLVLGIFAVLAEFERELISERTVAGLEAARARGRKGGRKFALTKTQVRLAQSAMAHRDTSVSELYRELGIRPVTLYRVRRPAEASCGSRTGRSWAPEPNDRAAGRV